MRAWFFGFWVGLCLWICWCVWLKLGVECTTVWGGRRAVFVLNWLLAGCFTWRGMTQFVSGARIPGWEREVLFDCGSDISFVKESLIPIFTET